MVSDRTNTGCNGPRRRSIPEGDLIDASVEQLVREKLLVGLDAVVNDFDFTKSRPKVRYPKNAPIPVEISAGVRKRGQYEGKLQIETFPATPWFRIKDGAR